MVLFASVCNSLWICWLKWVHAPTWSLVPARGPGTDFRLLESVQPKRVSCHSSDHRGPGAPPDASRRDILNIIYMFNRSRDLQKTSLQSVLSRASPKVKSPIHSATHARVRCWSQDSATNLARTHASREQSIPRMVSPHMKMFTYRNSPLLARDGGG